MTSSTSSSKIVVSLMGKCSICWEKESAATLVSSPPMSRCVDMVSCEARRKANAEARSSSFSKKAPIVEASFEPEAPSFIPTTWVTRPAIVETIRKGHVHYFRRVRHYIKDERGQEVLVREDLELVPDIKRATKFEPAQANQLAREWHAVAKEV